MNGLMVHQPLPTPRCRDSNHHRHIRAADRNGDEPAEHYRDQCYDDEWRRRQRTTVPEMVLQMGL